MEAQEAAAMVAAAVAEYGRAAAQPKFCMPSSAKFLNSKLARGLSAQRAYATSLAETLKDEASSSLINTTKVNIKIIRNKSGRSSPNLRKFAEPSVAN